MPSAEAGSALNRAEEIDPVYLIHSIIDSRWMIIVITAIMTLFALLYVLLETPVYQASALIQLEAKQGNGLFRNLGQILTDSQPLSAPETIILKSRLLLGKTVDDLGLQIHVEPDYFPVVGRGLARLSGHRPGEVKVRVFSLPAREKDVSRVVLTVRDSRHYQITRDGTTLTGTRGERLEGRGIVLEVSEINASPGSRFVLTRNPRLQAVTRLQETLRISEQGKNTGMLSLTLEGDDPQLISRILNTLSRHYVSQNIARQVAQDQMSLDFLNRQLPEVRAALDSAEDKLSAYRKQNNSVDLSLEAKSVLEQLVNIDNQLNELTFREAEISRRFRKEHPVYRALLEKRSALRKEKEKLNARVNGMPSTQQSVLRLSRDVESGRLVYQALLNRQQELSISRAGATGNVRIIDEAVTLPEPVRPRKLLTVLMGFLGGGMISTGTIVLRLLFRRGAESPEQLEAAGISVYACVPAASCVEKGTLRRIKSRPDTLLAVAAPSDIAVEAIRGLHTSLNYVMAEAGNNVLMISGASPGAGKTFISTNLAQVVAGTGKKVLLIDADLRRGYIHRLSGGEESEGLSGILSGRCSAGQARRSTGQSGFDYIGRGRALSHPSGLLMQPRFAGLMEQLCPQYDLVIIDTPPILAVTDAAITGRYAGTVMLVVRFGKDSVADVMASVKRFEKSGVKVKGCVLNGVVKTAGNSYRYGTCYYDYFSAENEKDGDA
ncbi:polysaccharide biosynthesis tyrosine autokinase [Salmonella enterica]|nr:polysaccharide biosynthesis tyrosine autokinase [Salmonella enterica]EIS6494153.1 polysaccharide biosynthesis tyrosine autokinase [Salmonella enterica]EIS6596615.1 polysaccharide biosynthesis tyrosine autokinase [Salmonella enterica]EIS6669571.1 polysaccharide biosynthesis tyrosine autokinase [Salmonella enterica]